jgi:hypothetical protein
MVRLMVITESQPTALGIVSFRVPDVVQTLPEGEVYESHTSGFIVAVVD